MDDHQDYVAGKLEVKQWPFHEPKLEVPTIYKAYVRPIKGPKEISPQNMASYCTVPPF